ncbi:MAG: glycosyltransferase [Salinibacterium sp.]|nr:MAG: glycosyltransferase [Salinibacterium sp.]
MTSKQPVVSLGVMCGDAHSGKPLERCLRSVLEKTNGCPVDEVVIGFNGKDRAQLDGTLRKLGYVTPAAWDAGESITSWSPPLTFPRPPLKVVTFEWPGRFDVARNIYWKHMTGEWLWSLDADDVLVDAGTEEGLNAIRNLERDYGLEPAKVGSNEKPVPLQQWLAALPPPTNAIFIGYDYQIDENNYVVIRLKSKRLVKRALGHIWWSPDESGVHEVLTPVGSTPELAITNLGILLRHHPSEEATQRAIRNTEIIKQMTKSDMPVEARHAYDTANAQVFSGDLTNAERSLLIAIQQATNDLDRYTYRLAYASLMLHKNDVPKALEVSCACITYNPEFQEAYFVACEAAYRMGKWAACVEWYERGLRREPMLLQRDQPLMRFLQPRGQTADAYLNLGQFEKGMALAREMTERYPNSPLAQFVLERATVALRLDKLATSLLDATDLLTDDAPSLSKMLIEQFPLFSATRGLMKSLRIRGTLAKLNRLTREQPATRMPLDGDWVSCDRIDTEDALREAGAIRLQLLSAEQVKKNHLRVKTRPAVLPSFAFYSPAAVEKWIPQNLLVKGLGGSESSLAHLARELAVRGHPVETYTPHPAGSGAFSLWTNEPGEQEFCVVQKDFVLMHEAASADVIITCRAPYLAREMREVWEGKPVFCWHQDNGYGNPWLWSKEVIEMQEHLHVSEWARKGLLREGYTGVTADKPWDGPMPELSTETYARHHLLGNGIPMNCLSNWDKVTRDPYRVIYASDPTRGLEELLEIWPRVKEAVPQASLYICGAYLVMLSLKQGAPGMPVMERVERITKRMDELAPLGVTCGGWQPQAVLLEAFKASGVYAYPGGPMPEGFGVSLVQAQACGCEVVCKEAGALPDVLHNHHVEWSLDNLVEALKEPMSTELRRDIAEKAVSRHGWQSVTDRFLSFVGERTK